MRVAETLVREGAVGQYEHFLFFQQRDERTDLLQIWKLKQQDSELDARNIHLGNINGELNLLGYWQENGERLVPFDTSASGMTIQLATNFIANVRRDLRSVYDLHALRRLNPDTCVPVRRYNTDPFFKETARDPIFADEAASGQYQFVSLDPETARGLFKGRI